MAGSTDGQDGNSPVARFNPALSSTLIAEDHGVAFRGNTRR